MTSMARITNARILLKEEYAFGPWPEDGPGWRITRVARERWRPDFKPSGFVHEVGIFMVVGGQGFHRCDRRTWELQSGDVVVRQPGAEYVTWSNPSSPLRMDVAVIAGSESTSVLESGLGQVPAVVRPARLEQVTAAYAVLFNAARVGGPFAPELCRHLFQAYLVTMRAGLAGHGLEGRGYAVFSRACRYIDEHADSLSSLPPVCRAAGVGMAHLSRLFQRYLGETPRTYLMRRKMQVAVDLLAGDGVSVGETAEALGFATPFAFSRAFRRVTGRTPSSVRR